MEKTTSIVLTYANNNITSQGIRAMFERGLTSLTLQAAFVAIAEIIVKHGSCSMNSLFGNKPNIAGKDYSSVSPYLRFMAGGNFPGKMPIEPLFTVCCLQYVEGARRPVNCYKFTPLGKKLWRKISRRPS